MMKMIEKGQVGQDLILWRNIESILVELFQNVLVSSDPQLIHRKSADSLGLGSAAACAVFPSQLQAAMEQSQRFTRRPPDLGKAH